MKFSLRVWFLRGTWWPAYRYFAAIICESTADGEDRDRPVCQAAQTAEKQASGLAGFREVPRNGPQGDGWTLLALDEVVSNQFKQAVHVLVPLEMLFGIINGLTAV